MKQEYAVKGERVLVVVAHPDDIEFLLAGTMLQLGDLGMEMVMWNMCHGDCGSISLDGEETRKLRARESIASAKLAGAKMLPSLFPDLSVFYDETSLRKVAGVIREVDPAIILTHGLQDYMEDHMAVARLVISSAFVRGMKNYRTEPDRGICGRPIALYHAMPHGLKDGMAQTVIPEFTVGIDAQMEKKRAMLACHASQKEWLDASQGMDAYLDEMENMAKDIAQFTPGNFQYAEGWRQHGHLGYSRPGYHPVQELLDVTKL